MTVSFKLISSSDCVAWLTVYGVEAVAIIMLNALTAIIYLKERSLRKPSMYLVINLAICDTLIGGLLILHVWFLGIDCTFWTSDLNVPTNLVTIALYRVSISICNKPCCYFFGADACNLSSVCASPRQKENLWSSCCGCLDNSWAYFNHQCL